MKTLFNFTRGELIAVICLLAIIVVIFLANIFYKVRGNSHFDYRSFQAEIDAFTQQQQWADSEYLANRQNQQNRNWQNQSYARDTYRSGYDTSWGKNNFANQKNAQYQIVKLNINRCDTTDIVAVPLFGSKRAQKMVEYRTKLGGFYSWQQVSEVFILQSISKEHLEKYFYLAPSEIKKLQVNSDPYKTLIAHPYLDSYLVKTIIQHREKRGKIKNMQEFQEITHAYPELVEKLTPYLSFE